MGEITPEDARDMLDYYATMDKEKQKYIIQNSGLLLETAYGTHRTIRVSKKSPLYLCRGISRNMDSSIILEGTDNTPLVQSEYYQLLKAVLNSELPDYIQSILRNPCTNMSKYIENVRAIEDWYTRNPNNGNENIEVLILSIYLYMADSLSVAYKIYSVMNDGDYEGGRCDVFKYILTNVRDSIIDPENANTEKLSDNIDSFYETITGCSPEQTCVLISLIKKFGLDYKSYNMDTKFNELMKDKSNLKELPNAKYKSSDLYKIVDILDRANIPRIIQKMRSFEKWSNEDSQLNSNVVVDVMPDKKRYFDNAITGLNSNDLPFITSATDSRIIPVRSGTSNRYYHFIIKNNNPLILYKLLPVDSDPNINTRYFAISLDPENELIGEITKDNNVTTEFVCENPNIALGKFFME